MLIACTTKGCLQTTEAKLNRETGEVICESCGNPILNITQFTKKALNSVGQVLRSNTKKPFQAHCSQCNTHRSLYVDEGKAYCDKCGNQVPVAPAFLHGLKLHLESQKKDE
jgi:Zn finger protein HypA/HybF involved in hydrogenase expression